MINLQSEYCVIGDHFDFKPLMHMSQNGPTHFKNLAAFAARYLKCDSPFWVIMH